MARREQSPQSRVTLQWLRALAPVLLLAMLAGSLFLWDSLRQTEQAQLKRELDAVAHGLAARIEGRINERMIALARMANRWRAAGGTPRDLWEVDAASHVRDMPGLISLQWLDATGKVRWVVPLAGNEKLVGTYPNRDPIRLRALQTAREQNKAVLSELITLIQGGTGVLVFQPLQAGGRFDGFLVSVVRLDPLMRSMLVPESRAWDFAVQYGGQTIYRSGRVRPATDAADQPSAVKLALGDGRWTVVAAQHPATPGRAPLSLIVLGAGLAGTLLVAGVLWFWHLALVRAAEAGQLAHIVASTTNAVILTDALGRVEWVNDGFTRITGYTLQEVHARKPGDVLQGSGTDPHTVARIREHLARGEGFREEILNYHKTGTPYWLDIEVQPIVDRNVVTGFMAIESDITERKQAEETLRLKEAKFRSLYELAPLGIALNRMADGQFIEGNRALFAMTGYSAEEFARLTYWDITPREYEAEEARQLERLKTEGRYGPYEKEYIHKSGRRFPVQLKGVRLTDARGEEVIWSVVEDITERKRAEQALHETRTFLETVIDSLPVMLFVKDAKELRFVAFNRAGEELLGLDREQLLGKNDYDLFPKEQADFFVERDREVLAQGSRLEIPEEPIDTPQGTRFLYTIKVPIHDAEGRPAYLLGISTDITESKKVERLKREFISTVSHELRTPLTSIRGSLGLVAGGAVGALPEKAKELLEIAVKNSERLTALINDILDVEKIESGKMKFALELQPVAPLVIQALEENAAYASALGVSFKLAAAIPAVEVNVDSGRFVQVMTNLLSNAAKFSPKGSVVDVGVTSSGDSVRIAVADQGPGVPEEFRERVFQKFSQADASDTRAMGGTGLGLAISKSIVERMGGRIGFESAAGRGATFYFNLPLGARTVSRG